jgi:MFS family permease
LLRHLSPDAAEDKIAVQSGLLLGVKTLAQVATTVPWGVVADAYGRKIVLVFGLAASSKTYRF